MTIGTRAARLEAARRAFTRFFVDRLVPELETRAPLLCDASELRDATIIWLRGVRCLAVRTENEEVVAAVARALAALKTPQPGAEHDLDRSRRRQGA